MEEKSNTAWIQVVSFQRLLTQGPSPKALANFPLGWRQLFARKSEKDERQHQTKVERSCVAVYPSLLKRGRLLLGDVSTDVVNFESSVDSRKMHSRTISRDSTSETAEGLGTEREITFDGL